MAILAGCAATPIEMPAGMETSSVTVGDESLNVLVADTSEKRRQGFQEVDSLPAEVDGMVFVFDSPRTSTFHMRNVTIPLDVWWFDGDGYIVGNAEMNTCLDGGCVSYASPGPVAWALETPAGEFEFSPGESLSFSE